MGIMGVRISQTKIDLNHKEYNSLRETYTDDVILRHIGDMVFNWTLDPDAFKVKADILQYGEEVEFVFSDNIGGNSFMDYIPMAGWPERSLTLQRNAEGFGYEVELNTKIFTIPSGTTTKQIKAGDVVIYKGNKLLIVYQNKTTIYNYIKIGELQLPSLIEDTITIRFK
jgi:hypothetical protein